MSFIMHFTMAKMFLRFLYLFVSLVLLLLFFLLLLLLPLTATNS